MAKRTIKNNEYTRFLSLLGMCMFNKATGEGIYKNYLTDVDEYDYRRILNEDKHYGMKMLLLNYLDNDIDIRELASIVYIADKLKPGFYSDVVERFIKNLQTALNKYKKTISCESQSLAKEFGNKLDYIAMKRCFNSKNNSYIPVQLYRAFGYYLTSQVQNDTDYSDNFIVWLYRAFVDNQDKICTKLHIIGNFDDMLEVFCDGSYLNSVSYKVLVWVCDKLDKNKEDNFLDSEKDNNIFKGLLLSTRTPSNLDGNGRDLKHIINDIDKNRIKVEFELSKYDLDKKVKSVEREVYKKNLQHIASDTSGERCKIYEEEIKKCYKDAKIFKWYSENETNTANIGLFRLRQMNFEYELEETKKVAKKCENLEREVNRNKSKLEKAKEQLKCTLNKVTALEKENKKLSKNQGDNIEKIEKKYISEIDSLNKKLFTSERELNLKDKEILQLKNRIQELERENRMLDNIDIDNDNMFIDNDVSVDEQFDITETLAEIHRIMGDRRVILIGGFDSWREEMQRYFPSALSRSTSKMKGKTDDIKEGDIVIINLRNMKHSVSVPAMNRCRSLGNIFILERGTNTQVTLARLYSMLNTDNKQENVV